MTYWCVVTKFFDNGKVKAKIFSVEADRKPEDGMVEKVNCDEYCDYFDSYDDASRFYLDSYYA